MFTKRLFLIVTWALFSPAFFGCNSDINPSPALNTEKTTPQPKLVVPEPEFDFGTVKQGQDVVHVFEILNEGDDTLIVSNVRSSCGCTVAALEKNSLAPGERTSIKTTFRTAGRSGTNTKSISLETNDPTTPRYKLLIKGSIEVDIIVTPKRISLGQIGPKQKANAEFEIQVNKPDKVQIGRISVVGDDRFKIKQTSLSSLGHKKYSLEFDGSEELGRFSKKLRIALVGTTVDHVSIPITVGIVSDLRYTKNLYFLKKEKEFEPRDIIVTTRSGKKVTLNNANDPDGRIALKITESNGQRTVVHAIVANTGEDYKKPVRGKIFFETSDKDEPVAKVSYMITERRGPRVKIPTTQNPRKPR